MGVAFGAVVKKGNITAPISLAFGIGMRNLFEGAAASLPYGERRSKWKIFFYGQLSGLVEIIISVLAALMVTIFTGILPYALGFAAGAMIFVVMEDFIPECQREGNVDLATISSLIGFVYDDIGCGPR
ncbi:MAG: hypothetical protein QFX38_07260 [Methanothermobacter sp.]|nr:hypothetical protein [Methanothermobacter sp.]